MNLHVPQSDEALWFDQGMPMDIPEPELHLEPNHELDFNAITGNPEDSHMFRDTLTLETNDNV